MTPTEKIALLRDLTRGADDVFAARTDGTWRPVYSPLEDKNVLMHLAGQMEIGSYPLIPTEDWPLVYWVAADFDGKKPGVMWKTDVQRAVMFLLDSGCSLLVNLSRSGQGAHIRALFKHPVPAWLARRWMLAWLEEAGVAKNADEWDDEVPPSFDRLIPPQDTLSGRTNRDGQRLPGNLIGSPLNGRLVRERNGATLPIDPIAVAGGSFEPDGHHWDHVRTALEQRTWSYAELLDALRAAPGSPTPEPPTYRPRSLPVIQADDRQLDYVLKFCAFMRHMAEAGTQSYPLWIALASELQRFGEAGRAAFHELSARDPRYRPDQTESKWQQTSNMHPIRCDTLVEMGYRCPHLTTPRCGGAMAPAYFAEHTDAEIL